MSLLFFLFSSVFDGQYWVCVFVVVVCFLIFVALFILFIFCFFGLFSVVCSCFCFVLFFWFYFKPASIPCLVLLCFILFYFALSCLWLHFFLYFVHSFILFLCIFNHFQKIYNLMSIPESAVLGYGAINDVSEFSDFDFAHAYNLIDWSKSSILFLFWKKWRMIKVELVSLINAFVAGFFYLFVGNIRSL